MTGGLCAALGFYAAATPEFRFSYQVTELFSVFWLTLVWEIRAHTHLFMDN